MNAGIEFLGGPYVVAACAAAAVVAYAAVAVVACIAVAAEVVVACTAVAVEAVAAHTAVAVEAVVACTAVAVEAVAACTAAAEAVAARTVVVEAAAAAAEAVAARTVVVEAAAAEARADPYLAAGRAAERAPHPSASPSPASDLILDSGMESLMLLMAFPTAYPSFLQQLERASVPSELVQERSLVATRVELGEPC